MAEQKARRRKTKAEQEAMRKMAEAAHLKTQMYIEAPSMKAKIEKGKEHIKAVKIERSREALEFVPSVALHLPSQTPAVLPTNTKSSEVTLFPDLGTAISGTATGIRKRFRGGPCCTPKTRCVR